MSTIRIHHYLADCGIASRRKSEQLISAGRVAVNNICIARSQFIDPERDRVTVDNHTVSKAPKLYYVLHKPVNVVCSSQRQGGCIIVSDCMLIFQKMHLFTVGRLDRMASGLLFVTNDGIFSQHVMLPSNQIEKEYLVHTYNRISQNVLAKFCKSQNTGAEYNIKRYRLLSNKCVMLVLTEGKKHEIRNLMKACGCGIRSLIRIRIGSVMLGNLKAGKYREFTKSERDTMLPTKQAV